MRWILVLLAIAASIAPVFADDEALRAHAVELAQKFIIVDGHVDIPYRLYEKDADISTATNEGDFDYPRAKKGGLNAPFMSIYIPSRYEEGGAFALANQLIDMVEGFQKKWPDKFAVARSVADVRDQFAKGLISLPMGMENGSPIEGKLENIKYFRDRGIRYITLTHGKNNHICDSSYDPERKWKGLSPFGREVVAEMNRVGIMIDVAHISDDTFHQVMELSKVPVIASHSSCRFFTPGFERNMSDEMIKKMAAKGGVIMINFGSGFISAAVREKEDEARKAFRALLEEKKLTMDSAEAKALRKELEKNAVFADVSDVVDHIDHAVKLVGIDHVGLGSDFDGVGDSLPTGLKDVSYYPNLLFHLLKRGYSDADIEKICSGNVLRVWSAVEAYAAGQP